ncbi:MAG TPA: hypothetical protein VFH80_30695 [Solirubrobacteraceae bacterium]|nr:hypothetical protein [Solirubrobacteraceae bacterium]
MIPTAILNAILAVGVLVMVVTPLVWAILTQRRDHPRPAASVGATAGRPTPQPRRPSSRPRHTAVIDRA